MFEIIPDKMTPGRAPKVNPEKAGIWFSSIDEILDPKKLCAVLSDDELERLRRFHQSNDQMRFLAGRAGLRFVLSEYFHVEPKSLRLKQDRFGKPSLITSGGHGPFFNVSHSGAFAVIAVDPCRPIGIDIEVVRAVPQLNSIIDIALSPAEVESLHSYAPCALPRAFLRLWTGKEALLKAVGVGLGMDMREIQLMAPPNQNLKIISAPPGLRGFSVTEMRLPDTTDYVGAVAVGQ